MQLEKGDVIFADMGSENTTDHTQKGWRPVLVLEFFSEEYDLYRNSDYFAKQKKEPSYTYLCDKRGYTCTQR